MSQDGTNGLRPPVVDSWHQGTSPSLLVDQQMGSGFTVYWSQFLSPFWKNNGWLGSVSSTDANWDIHLGGCFVELTGGMLSILQIGLGWLGQRIRGEVFDHPILSRSFETSLTASSQLRWYLSAMA